MSPLCIVRGVRIPHLVPLKLQARHVSMVGHQEPVMWSTAGADSVRSDLASPITSALRRCLCTQTQTA